MTAMMHAAKGGHHAMVRYFIETRFTQDYMLSQVFAQNDPKVTNVILRAWLALLCHVTHAELGVLWRCIEDTERKLRDAARQ
jgi:hypothetical protein